MLKRTFILTMLWYTAIVTVMVIVVNVGAGSEVKVTHDEEVEVEVEDGSVQDTDSLQTDNKAKGSTSDETVTGEMKGKVSAFDTYLRLFEHSRAIQLDAVKSIEKFGSKHEHRHKLVKSMLVNLFKVLQAAREELTEYNFVAGDPFPENQTIQDSVSKVLQNTALFGDLVLRFPDITQSIYKKKREWEHLIGWAIFFSSESEIFTGPHLRLLNLMRMELGIMPKDENYFNPFKNNIEDRENLEDVALAEIERKKIMLENKRKKKKSLRRKGPSLGGTQHTEL